MSKVCRILPLYPNAHANAKKIIFDIQYPGNRFEFDIISNDFWSSAIWASHIWLLLNKLETPKNPGIQPRFTGISSLVYYLLGHVTLMYDPSNYYFRLRKFGPFEENFSDNHTFRRKSQWTKLATECICRHMTEEVLDQTWDRHVYTSASTKPFISCPGRLPLHQICTEAIRCIWWNP